MISIQETIRQLTDNAAAIRPLRQVNELLFAWDAKQALPYSVDYAGGW